MQIKLPLKAAISNIRQILLFRTPATQSSAVGIFTALPTPLNFATFLHDETLPRHGPHPNSPALCTVARTARAPWIVSLGAPSSAVHDHHSRVPGAA